jgi:hypothetical protein
MARGKSFQADYCQGRRLTGSIGSVAEYRLLQRAWRMSDRLPGVNHPATIPNYILYLMSY